MTLEHNENSTQFIPPHKTEEEESPPEKKPAVEVEDSKHEETF